MGVVTLEVAVPMVVRLLMVKKLTIWAEEIIPVMHPILCAHGVPRSQGCREFKIPSNKDLIHQLAPHSIVCLMHHMFKWPIV